LAYQTQAVNPPPVNASGGNLFQGAGNILSNPYGYLSSLGGNFANAYSNALNANVDLYRQTQTGYGITGANQRAAQAQIGAGWSGLDKDVLGMLGIGTGGAVGAGGVLDASKFDITKGAAGVQPGSFGIATPGAQAIASNYISNQGAQQQALINAGLGGGTVAANAAGQNAFQANQALGGLGAQLALTGAGYAANIGMGALNYANQANMQNTALDVERLKAMQQTTIPYPSTAAYGSMFGAALQAALRGQGAAGNRQAVVNPFGSSSGGSQGHTGFISGSGQTAAATPPPQQTGYGMFANQLGFEGANAVGYGTLSQQQISELRDFGNVYTSQGAANEAANAANAASGSSAYSYDPLGLLDQGYDAADVAAFYGGEGGGGDGGGGG
jgi:hypothetical protein